MPISEIRSEIDRIDDEIVKLLASRQALVERAARYKTNKQAVRAPDRRAAMLTRLHELALREGVSTEVVRAVYDAMIDGYIALELRERARIYECGRLSVLSRLSGLEMPGDHAGDMIASRVSPPQDPSNDVMTGVGCRESGPMG